MSNSHGFYYDRDQGNLSDADFLPVSDFTEDNFEKVLINSMNSLNLSEFKSVLSGITFAPDNFSMAFITRLNFGILSMHFDNLREYAGYVADYFIKIKNLDPESKEQMIDSFLDIGGKYEKDFLGLVKMIVWRSIPVRFKEYYQ